METRKIPGFTLIELLIVIAIIGILAVAFLPTLLGAPAKGRDTQRIADMQKIQKVLINAGLEGKALPASGTVSATLLDFVADFGGALPVDPQGTNPYRYFLAPAGGYAFAVQAKMETTKAGNARCAVPPYDTLGTVGTPFSLVADSCYVVLSK